MDESGGFYCEEFSKRGFGDMSVWVNACIPARKRCITGLNGLNGGLMTVLETRGAQYLTFTVISKLILDTVNVTCKRDLRTHTV